MFNLEGIERPHPNKEIEYNMNVLQNIFLELFDNDIEEARLHLFHWVCLCQGAISNLLFLPVVPPIKDRKEIEPKILFDLLMTSFINSIGKNDEDIDILLSK